MDIENNIFKRYSPDFDKLIKYGFKKKNNVFVIEKLFKDNLFKAVIEITFQGKISGTVFDLENDDEFLPLRQESYQGAFISEVRAAYEELLENIRENCFSKKYFVYPQSNRITSLIKEKYGNEPEFLWEKFPGSGVFRNPETKKWYLAILDVDSSKIKPGTKGIIEIADIKLAPEKIEKLTLSEHFYPAYHMNKKNWIMVILDESVADKTIMELVEESHNFSKKK